LLLRRDGRLGTASLIVACAGALSASDRQDHNCLGHDMHTRSQCSRMSHQEASAWGASRVSQGAIVTASGVEYCKTPCVARAVQHCPETAMPSLDKCTGG